MVDLKWIVNYASANHKNFSKRYTRKRQTQAVFRAEIVKSLGRRREVREWSLLLGVDDRRREARAVPSSVARALAEREEDARRSIRRVALRAVFRRVEEEASRDPRASPESIGSAAEARLKGEETMTKKEWIEQGVTDGVDAYKNSVSTETRAELMVDRDGGDPDSYGYARAIAGSVCRDWMVDRKIRLTNGNYYDAFCKAFVSAWSNEFHAQPEQVAKRRNEELRRRLDRMIETAESSLAKFKERLDEDPWHAFRWSDDAVAGSVASAVAKQCLAALDRTENPQTPEQIVDYASRQALRRARYPERGSQIDVFIGQAETKAWAEIGEQFLW